MNERDNTLDIEDPTEVDAVNNTIEVQEASAVSYNDFFHNHLQKNFPVILCNVGEDWPCFKDWVTSSGTPNFDFLSLYEAKVAVALCGTKKYNAQEKVDMQFSDFLNYWKTYVPDEDECLYLKDWHFVRDFSDKRVYRVPKFFANDWLGEHYDAHPELNDDYRFVYIGPRGSWTPLHVDVFHSYSWSINITGRKKWVLLEPGVEAEFTDKLGNLTYDYHFSPSPSRAGIYYVEQGPGEAIFVPSGWHHQVWNLEDTISINHNWVNSSNIMHMWNDLKRNLEKVKTELGDLCQDFDVLQKVLKAHYGMDQLEFACFIKEREEARRTHCLQNKSLPVYGDWFLGNSILSHDMDVIQSVTKEVQLLLNKCD